MLRELEYHEIRAFEILSFDIFTPQAGLPGPVRQREPITDEQEAIIAKAISDVRTNAAIRAGDYDEFEF
jgi:hypothetical protein